MVDTVLCVATIGGWLTNFKRLHVLDPWQENILTIGDFEHFRSYITDADVEKIASFGLDHVRLGFDQLVIEDIEKPYTYREEIFEIIDSFIESCEKRGLSVILNLHKAIGLHCDTNDDVYLLDDEELRRRFKMMWVAFEKRYSHKPQIVFELLNEVKHAPEKWNSLANETISEIRKLNRNRRIIVGGAFWNSPAGLLALNINHDDNIMYTFHFYEPFEFTHQRGVLQKSCLFYNRDMEYPGDIEKYRDFRRVACGEKTPYTEYSVMDRKFVYDKLAPALEFKNKYPERVLWLGEFGTIRHCKTLYRENYMRDVISFCIENGLPYCVWNYLSTPNDGNRFSLVTDDEREIVSERMLRIINGVDFI